MVLASSAVRVDARQAAELASEALMNRADLEITLLTHNRTWGVSIGLFILHEIGTRSIARDQSFLISCKSGTSYLVDMRVH